MDEGTCRAYPQNREGYCRFPNAGELFDAVGTAAVGLMARNTLAVIDDLERRDDALSIKAAMGVITHLVESRNCRVVLISNDRMLEREEEKNEFQRQKEKIFDIEMEYAPTVEENANLILKKEKELILSSTKWSRNPKHSGHSAR